MSQTFKYFLRNGFGQTGVCKHFKQNWREPVSGGVIADVVPTNFSQIGFEKRFITTAGDEVPGCGNEHSLLETKVVHCEKSDYMRIMICSCKRAYPIRITYHYLRRMNFESERLFREGSLFKQRLSATIRLTLNN